MGEVTYFTYADEGLVGEYDSSGMLAKTYGWQPDGLWGTDPLYMVDGGSYYFYHNDHLGTPQRMTGITGAVDWSAEYKGYGLSLVHPISSVENNLRFPGQYYNVETQLNYNVQRYYNTITGRYTQVDPIRFDGKDINLYRYAKNNSNNNYDIFGMECIPDGKRIGEIKKEEKLVGKKEARVNCYMTWIFPQPSYRGLDIDVLPYDHFLNNLAPDRLVYYKEIAYIEHQKCECSDYIYSPSSVPTFS